jgi:hypothetical protein
MTSSLQLLDSLTVFYQQERYWTHHTRAALETVLSDSFRGNVEAFMGAAKSETPDDGESSVNTNPIEVRVEPSSSMAQSENVQRRRSRWNRRKNTLKLRLGGIETPIRMQTMRPSQHILDMFAALVESRMESCERVTKLVKLANRADYHRGFNGLRGQ